jgi:hypothetical protein
MLASVTMALLWSSDSVDAIEGLVVAAVIAVLAILWYLREGRNSALEQVLVQSEFGSPAAFRGSLAVEEYKPGNSLRLCKSTTAARILQLKYRWLGMGRQAIFDEVTFDRARGVVELKRKKKYTTASFSEFAAVRMREVAGHRGAGSIWHVELVPHKGRPTPFVTSVRGDRRTMFEHTAPVAKAVSEIMASPVQVFVAGNVWTPGWPPKSSMASKS